MIRDELEGMTVLAAVAEAGSLRAAGERLGVTGSAVSQALRKLEERLGVTLAPRTTRSARLTGAGERLYAAVRPALDEVRAAAAAVGELGGAPRGTLRLNVSSAAESFLCGPLLAEFRAAFPDVRLDLIVSDDPVDIVAAGYDAGVRLGEVIDRDMIAVPVSGEMQLVVVGAPSYFAHHPKPVHPRDLAAHTCINWHASAGAVPYRWEFTEDGRDFAVAVDAPILTNDPELNVRLARAGAGLIIAWANRVREDVARGDLVPVLEAVCPSFPGCYLFYPQRRHAPPALRALIDHLRRAKQLSAPPAAGAERRARGTEVVPPPRAGRRHRG
jgi:DNA-binding transcriptional LysR family regulator